MIRRAVLCLFLTAPFAVRAESVTDLAAGEKGRVATVIDGDTIRLEGGDADIRLIGLQAPKLPLGRKDFQTWPLAKEARDALVKLAEGREVNLRLGTQSRDRNGRILAHVVRDDGVWIQGEMLRLGWARMYTFPDNRRLAAELRAKEKEARDAHRGIWADGYYAVRTADAPRLLRDNGTFQIVTGRVAAAEQVKDRIYLNFGADFRSDFTVSIAKRDWTAFEKSGLDPLNLKDTEIEVRGWVSLRGGPAIEVTHPEQIAVIQR